MQYETIVVAVLSLIGTLAGAYLSNKKSSALIAYRLERLEEKANDINTIEERVYRIEENQSVVDEKIKNVNCRITDLEKSVVSN
jgi:hypothetical protein